MLDRTATNSYKYKISITNPAHFVVHAAYNSTSVVNDIGMIFLQSAPQNLTTSYSGIATISLPISTDVNVNLTSKTGTISGYGMFNDSADSKTLRWANAPIISNDECKKTFGPYVTNGNVCISTKGGFGTCAGDSGGPLVTEIRTGVKTLVGIISFGAAAGCSKGYPAAFTRVTSFSSWIDANFKNPPK